MNDLQPTRINKDKASGFGMDTDILNQPAGSKENDLEKVSEMLENNKKYFEGHILKRKKKTVNLKRRKFEFLLTENVFIDSFSFTTFIEILN